MSKKADKIRLLEEEIAQYQHDVEFLEERIVELTNKVAYLILPEPQKKPLYAGAISFDFWPWRDWFRLHVHKWNPGKRFQFCIGPLRLDFWQD